MSGRRIGTTIIKHPRCFFTTKNAERCLIFIYHRGHKVVTERTENFRILMLPNLNVFTPVLRFWHAKAWDLSSEVPLALDCLEIKWINMQLNAKKFAFFLWFIILPPTQNNELRRWCKKLNSFNYIIRFNFTDRGVDDDLSSQFLFPKP